jgi:Flp pilus assembly protein TadG
MSACPLQQQGIESYRARGARLRRRPGAATVELSLVLPLLVFLLLVGMDYSRVFYASVIVANCARNGAIWMTDPNLAIRSSFETVEDAVAADASDLPDTLQVTTNTGTDSSGYQWSEVTVVYQFQTVVNYPGIPNQVNISRTVRMRNVPDYSTDDS